MSLITLIVVARGGGSQEYWCGGGAGGLRKGVITPLAEDVPAIGRGNPSSGRVAGHPGGATHQTAKRVIRQFHVTYGSCDRIRNAAGRRHLGGNTRAGILSHNSAC